MTECESDSLIIYAEVDADDYGIIGLTIIEKEIALEKKKNWKFIQCPQCVTVTILVVDPNIAPNFVKIPSWTHTCPDCHIEIPIRKESWSENVWQEK